MGKSGEQMLLCSWLHVLTIAWLGFVLRKPSRSLSGFSLSRLLSFVHLAGWEEHSL